MAGPAALQVGLDLVRASELSRKTKTNYCWAWRRWVGACQDLDIPSLGATADDALRWLQAGQRSRNEVRETRKALSFVHQALGLASPLRERRVMHALFGQDGTVRWRSTARSTGPAWSTGSPIICIGARATAGIPCPPAGSRWPNSCCLSPTTIPTLRWSWPAPPSPSTWRRTAIPAPATIRRSRGPGPVPGPLRGTGRVEVQGVAAQDL